MNLITTNPMKWPSSNFTKIIFFLILSCLEKFNFFLDIGDITISKTL